MFRVTVLCTPNWKQWMRVEMLNWKMSSKIMLFTCVQLSKTNSKLCTLSTTKCRWLMFHSKHVNWWSFPVWNHSACHKVIFLLLFFSPFSVNHKIKNKLSDVCFGICSSFGILIALSSIYGTNNWLLCSCTVVYLITLVLY